MKPARHGDPKPHLRARKVSMAGRSAFQTAGPKAFNNTETMADPNQAFSGQVAGAPGDGGQ